jgi:hypothetical protein
MREGLAGALKPHADDMGRRIVKEMQMSSQVASQNTEAAIFARLIQARTEMSNEIARYLLAFDFESDDVARMNFLAERARKGVLSAEETGELDSYLHVGNLLTIMQSKARVYLKTQDRCADSQ